MITTNELFFFAGKGRVWGRLFWAVIAPQEGCGWEYGGEGGKVRRRRRDWPLRSVHKLTFKSHLSLVFPNLSDFYIKIHFAWFWTRKFCTTNCSYFVFVTSPFTSSEKEK